MEESDNKEVLDFEKIRKLFENNIFFSDKYVSFLKNWLKEVHYAEVEGKKFPYIKTITSKKMLAIHHYSDDEIEELNREGIKVFAIKQNENSLKNYHVLPYKPYSEILTGYHRSFRYYVRKSNTLGLKLSMDWDLDKMYENYLETMKRLNSIVFPKKYFEALKNVLHAKAFNVVEKGCIVASMVTIENGDNLYFLFGFSNKRGREVFANYFLYDALFSYASEKRLNVHLGAGFDGEGSEDFKSRTGAFKLKVLIFPKESVNLYGLQKMLLKLPISFSHRFFSTRFFNRVIKSIIPYT